mgnify:CR=1 FL=1
MIHSTKLRGMEHYRGEGYLCGNVENKLGKFSADLFGLFDFVALGYKQTIGVQACSASGGEIDQHKAKMLASRHLERVFAAGWEIHLIAFYPWRDEDRRDEFKQARLVRTGKDEYVWV